MVSVWPQSWRGTEGRGGERCTSPGRVPVPHVWAGLCHLPSGSESSLVTEEDPAGPAPQALHSSDSVCPGVALWVCFYDSLTCPPSRGAVSIRHRESQRRPRSVPDPTSGLAVLTHFTGLFPTRKRREEIKARARAPGGEGQAGPRGSGRGVGSTAGFSSEEGHDLSH